MRSTAQQPQLIVMLKYPQPGVVKTRLAPVLGERRACGLYRAMVRHTLGEARRFVSKSSASLVARVAGAPDDGAVRQWLGDGIHFQPQGDGDLGQRMERAVHEVFTKGASSVVVIGADCPGLTADHLETAFRALESNDAVFGPAVDGGYYLIGLRRFLPELFRNISWSTESVLDETMTAANGAGVEWELLQTLHDLDRPDDLPLWAQQQLSPVYWLNIADTGFPFGGVIEHTNLVPVSDYNGTHLIYLSRYFTAEEPIASISESKTQSLMLASMSRIWPAFSKEIVRRIHVFRAQNAAVVCDRNFSKKIPPCRTPIKNTFVANMAHVYPDERSCNNSIRVAAESLRVMGVDTSCIPRGISLAGSIGME
jgi:rSAM/selenodomain-associated transferase 1